MGNLLARRGLKKRPRSEGDDDDEVAGVTRTAAGQCVVENETDVTALLQARVGTDARPLCRCVVQGDDAVQRRYGSHYHLYASTSPDDEHGIALVWSVRRACLSVFALLAFCRVANSCRKRAALLDDGGDTLLLLRYTAEL